MNKLECKYKFQNKEKFDGKPYCTCHNELCQNISFACDKNCQIYEDYKQLQQLKVENEKLKEQVQFKNQFRDYAHNYKQCLDEIEKILKTVCQEECDFKWCKGRNHCGDDDCRYMQIMEQIIGK